MLLIINIYIFIKLKLRADKIFFIHEANCKIFRHFGLPKMVYFCIYLQKTLILQCITIDLVFVNKSDTLKYNQVLKYE